MLSQQKYFLGILWWRVWIYQKPSELPSNNNLKYISNTISWGNPFPRGSIGKSQLQLLQSDRNRVMMIGHWERETYCGCFCGWMNNYWLEPFSYSAGKQPVEMNIWWIKPKWKSICTCKNYECNHDVKCQYGTRVCFCLSFLTESVTVLSLTHRGFITKGH